MKWLNGIRNSNCRSRFKYLMKLVSSVTKQSSGRIPPKRTPCVWLNDTTPFPKSSGLIENSRDTVFAEKDDFVVLGEEAESQQITNPKETNSNRTHRVHVLTVISKSAVSLHPETARKRLLFLLILQNQRKYTLQYIWIHQLLFRFREKWPNKEVIDTRNRVEKWNSWNLVSHLFFSSFRFPKVIR